MHHRASLFQMRSPEYSSKQISVPPHSVRFLVNYHTSDFLLNAGIWLVNRSPIISNCSSQGFHITTATSPQGSATLITVLSCSSEFSPNAGLSLVDRFRTLSLQPLITALWYCNCKLTELHTILQEWFFTEYQPPIGCIHNSLCTCSYYFLMPILPNQIIV